MSVKKNLDHALVAMTNARESATFEAKMSWWERARESVEAARHKLQHEPRSYARWLGFDPDWTVCCPLSTQEERYDDLVRHARKVGLDPEQVLVSRESFEKGEKEAAESAARQQAAFERALAREMPTRQTIMEYLNERLDTLRRRAETSDAHLARLEERVQRIEGGKS